MPYSSPAMVKVTICTSSMLCCARDFISSFSSPSPVLCFFIFFFSISEVSEETREFSSMIIIRRLPSSSLATALSSLRSEEASAGVSSITETGTRITSSTQSTRKPTVMFSASTTSARWSSQMCFSSVFLKRPQISDTTLSRGSVFSSRQARADFLSFFPCSRTVAPEA